MAFWPLSLTYEGGEKIGGSRRCCLSTIEKLTEGRKGGF